MCGRYQFTAVESESVRRILRAVEQQYGAGAWQPGEVFPSAPAPVLIQTESGAAVRLALWGFPGGQRGLIINARAETAEQRPMFRGLVSTGRCVVPTSGFYEWDAARHKYLFRLPGSEVVYLAGLWEQTEEESHFTILTTAPNASVADVHDRMPLVLPPEAVRPWLSDQAAARRLLHAEPPLLHSAAESGQLRMW